MASAWREATGIGYVNLILQMPSQEYQLVELYASILEGEGRMITIDDLKNIRRQRLRVTSLRERIDSLRARAEYTARQLGEGGQDDATRDRLAEYVAELDDLERQLTEEMITLEQGIMAVDKALTELPENQELVLRLRYCEGLTWRQVAEATHYCEQHCRKIAHLDNYNERMYK